MAQSSLCDTDLLCSREPPPALKEVLSSARDPYAQLSGNAHAGTRDLLQRCRDRENASGRPEAIGTAEHEGISVALDSTILEHALYRRPKTRPAPIEVEPANR